ncbi:MAG TPA: hypothetical protein VFY14_10920 [Streptomyces sp.]|nr:hypothetical protein [Streptomyces sp.]
MTTTIRPAVLSLLRDLHFREPESQDRPCRIMRTPVLCGLVVPAMYGPYDFLRAVHRSTVDEAKSLDLIILGPLEDMPRYNYGGDRWGYDRCHYKGRTIALTDKGRGVVEQ